MPEIERASEKDDPIDEAELAAAAFLARYRARTLDAYRYDLRAFFQWAADDRLDILKATRPQIELYVRAMEARGLARRCRSPPGTLILAPRRSMTNADRASTATPPTSWSPS